MSKSEKAVQCFNGAINCAQAILSTYGGEYGLDTELALKVSGGFGAGMGRTCETCGAVTGAYMVIGLRYGYISPVDTEGKERVYAMIQEFTRRFKERNQSTICERLLGTHMVSGDRELAARQVKEVCPKMVRDAAEILESIFG
jgi:C_GCAxxG_C_C family probable redox protein